MPGFVKTLEDEKIWEKAKNISSNKFAKKTRRFYAYANSIFHKIKKPNNDLKIELNDYLTDFKTWFDEQDDSLLKRIPKCKYDKTKFWMKDVVTGKKIGTKPTEITVWGSPKNYNYVRN